MSTQMPSASTTAAAAESLQNLHSFLDNPDKIPDGTLGFSASMLKRMAPGIIQWHRGAAKLGFNLYPAQWDKALVLEILKEVRKVLPVNHERPDYDEPRMPKPSRIEVGKLAKDAWHVNANTRQSKHNHYRAGPNASRGVGKATSVSHERRVGQPVYLQAIPSTTPGAKTSWLNVMYVDGKGSFVPAECVENDDIDGDGVHEAHAEVQFWKDKKARLYVPELNKAYLRYWLAAQAYAVAVGIPDVAQAIGDHVKGPPLAKSGHIGNMLESWEPVGAKFASSMKVFAARYNEKVAEAAAMGEG